MRKNPGNNRCNLYAAIMKKAGKMAVDEPVFPLV